MTTQLALADSSLSLTVAKSQENHATLGDMHPMQFCLLVRQRALSNLIVPITSCVGVSFVL
jgi:hypothetical protein